MLRTRTDLWRLALFTSLGICPNACGGRTDNNTQSEERLASESETQSSSSAAPTAPASDPSGTAPTHTTAWSSPSSTSPQVVVPAIGETPILEPPLPPPTTSAVPPTGTTVDIIDAGIPTTSATATPTSAVDGAASTVPPNVDGGGAVNPVSCDASEPVIRFAVDTGLAQCGAVVSRPSADVVCESKIPRASESQVADAGSDGIQCQSDADCTERPLGYCDSPEGLVPYKQCYYGCVQDSDCAADQACVCGDPVGSCISATCRQDADCEPGMKCAEWIDPNGIGCPHSHYLSCQTAQDECATDADCEGGDYGRFCSGQSGVRQCVDIPGVACGRPFLVEGKERLAALVATSDWAGQVTGGSLQRLTERERAVIGQRWADIGLMEHASIAAFARFTLQLLHLGAPVSLIEAAQQAMVDETEHAKACFGLARRYLGHAVGPGTLVMDQALAETSLEDIVRLAVREGCIGETFAALEAAEACALAQDAQVRAVLDKIRGDEFAHAQLAWRFVQWALNEVPADSRRGERLRAMVADELSTAQLSLAQAGRAPKRERKAGLDAESSDLARHGIVSASLSQEIRRRALLDVVLPCATQLLQQSAARGNASRAELAQAVA